MQKRSDELVRELEPTLKSDYCPERELAGARAHLRELERWARDVQLELAFRRYSRAAAALIERGECDA